jgi:hypothetical protein
VGPPDGAYAEGTHTPTTTTTTTTTTTRLPSSRVCRKPAVRQCPVTSSRLGNGDAAVTGWFTSASHRPGRHLGCCSPLTLCVGQARACVASDALELGLERLKQGGLPGPLHSTQRAAGATAPEQRGRLPQGHARIVSVAYLWKAETGQSWESYTEPSRMGRGAALDRGTPRRPVQSTSGRGVQSTGRAAR